MGDSLVSNQATMSRKATPTKPTEVFSYISMCFLMHIEVILLSVALGTEPTSVALFTSVDSFVHIQVFFARKAFLTGATDMEIWFFGMRSFVKVKVVFTSKA